jgi:flagellar motor switch protein FliN
MSDGHGDAGEGIRVLIGGLGSGLAQVLESMTDRRPETSWEPVTCTLADIEAAPDAEMLWWQQKFQILPEPALWVGAPRGAWEELGGRTLRAAGLEEIDTADARNTWLEILNQSLGATARIAGERLGEEVTCAEGAENAPLPDSDRWFRIVLTFEQPLPPIWVRPSTALLDRLSRAALSPDPGVDSPSPHGGPVESRHAGLTGSRTMDLLLDVELPVSLSFGRSQVPLKDVLKLTTGSIVELNRGVSEPVDVLVNQCLIARGEVVVIDGNYAVRIQQIVSTQERLRSVR